MSKAKFFFELRYEKNISTTLIMRQGWERPLAFIDNQAGGRAEAFGPEASQALVLGSPESSKKLFLNKYGATGKFGFSDEVRNAFGRSLEDLIERPASYACEEIDFIVKAHKSLSRIGRASLSLRTNSGIRLLVLQDSKKMIKDYKTGSWLQGMIEIDGLPGPVPIGLSVGNRAFDFESDFVPYLEKLEKTMRSLYRSTSVFPKTYTVVLSPDVASLFVHEVLGHFCEADCVKDPNWLAEILPLKARLAPEILTITDDPTDVSGPGHYLHDDQGIPARRNFILEEGILSGRLHNLRTAAALGEEPTGNGRSAAPWLPSVVRQSNFRIEPGETPEEGLFEGISEGLYIDWSLAGSHKNCEALIATRIRKGRLADTHYYGVKIHSSLGLLGNIQKVGNNFQYSPKGVCGKFGYFLYAIGRGSPSLVCSDVPVSPITPMEKTP